MTGSWGACTVSDANSAAHFPSPLLGSLSIFTFPRVLWPLEGIQSLLHHICGPFCLFLGAPELPQEFFPEVSFSSGTSQPQLGSRDRSTSKMAYSHGWQVCGRRQFPSNCISPQGCLSILVAWCLASPAERLT